ncbi:MAG: carbohydrate ABC transporter substrate-binding protein, partial [Oscillospiraceae bacterium]|nr:carbohydrate ABC transporter substrate-binding protein [Oscillospiraceae bacterium]
MKKLLALLLCLVMVVSMAACGAKTEAPAAPAETPAEAPAEAPAETGKTVLNIWSFTDEVPKMIDKFMELNPEFAEKYETNVTIIATTDGLYQPALDQALIGGGAEAPDLYCAEAAF